METLQLKAETRTKLGKKVKELRKNGFIPAVLYGHKIKNIPLKVEYQDFQKIHKEAGESTLIELEVIPKRQDKAEKAKKGTKKVLIHNIQFDPVRGEFLHIDFYQVKMTEEITTEIALKFIGQSLAVKNKEGVLIKNIDKLPVKCLPQALTHNIEVDVSRIKELEESIYVKDLSIPKGINVLAGSDEPIATVIPPRTREELEEAKGEEVKPEEVKQVGEEVSSEEESEETEKDKKKDKKEKK